MDFREVLISQALRFLGIELKPLLFATTHEQCESQ